MSSILGFLRRNYNAFIPATVPKADDAIKIGILGAAKIAPMALILPARTHPEVIVQSVAARDHTRATAYAKKNKIPHVFDSYQAILDDHSIDAVYIPLPNALHFEWALKAVAAGKHVLLEKPCASNAEEAERLFSSPVLRADKDAPVLLEAFHYRFSPNWVLFDSLLDRDRIEHVEVNMHMPGTWLYNMETDIRFDYGLSGGALMHTSYTLSVLLGVFAAAAEECVSSEIATMEKVARHGGGDKRCDASYETRWRFAGGATAEARGSLLAPLTGGDLLPKVMVRHKPVLVPEERDVTGEARENKTRRRTVTMENWLFGTAWHRIVVEDEFVVFDARDDMVVKKRWKTREVKKAYTMVEAGMEAVAGQPHWTTYRWQLEQFVNRIKGRKGSGAWLDGEESIRMMKMVDMAYAKGGLPARPTSDFSLDAGGTRGA